MFIKKIKVFALPAYPCSISYILLEQFIFGQRPLVTLISSLIIKGHKIIIDILYCEYYFRVFKMLTRQQIYAAYDGAVLSSIQLETYHCEDQLCFVSIIFYLFLRSQITVSCQTCLYIILKRIFNYLIKLSLLLKLLWLCLCICKYFKKAFYRMSNSSTEHSKSGVKMQASLILKCLKCS